MRRSLVFVVLMLLMSTAPMMTTYAQGTGDSLIINEIYASPNTEQYGGIDWNERDYNYYDPRSGSRDPSDESHGYFEEMQSDVEASEDWDQDDED